MIAVQLVLMILLLVAVSVPFLRVQATEEASYHDWDRDTHHTLQGEWLGQRQGPGEIVIDRSFEFPVRLLVQLQTDGESTRRPQIFVHGVNTAEGGASIISCASCTTNCITPVIEILGRRLGILKATMTTIHAYTASQALVDRPSKDRRRGRAAAINLVPASTGAAKATIEALPEYHGKFDGVAIRTPVPVGSIADIVCLVARRTSTDEVNRIFREEAESARYHDIVGVSDEAIVSTDIMQDRRASIIDCTLTQVVDGDLVKVMSWYDNEYGYSNRLVDLAVHMGKYLER